MLWILPAELGEVLAEFQLQIGRQRCRKRVCLFQLDPRITGGIDFEDDVAESLEVRIDRSVQRNLGVGNRKSPNFGVVVPTLDRSDVGLGRPASVCQRDKANVHVAACGAWTLARCRSSSACVSGLRAQLLFELLNQRNGIGARDAICPRYRIALRFWRPDLCFCETWPGQGQRADDK